MLSLLLLLSVAAPRFVGGQIAQTNAACTSEYTWMGNSNGTSPCLLVAQLDAQCNGGSWTIVPLNNSHYNPPVDQYASYCTCSWASYNLISACTACQGFQDQIAFWDYYIAGCSGKTTDNTYWPPSISLPTQLRIPYWASTDPTLWTNKKFNSADAKTIYQASHPDLSAPTSQSSSSSSSSPTGAIIGGVIGGLVAIIVFIVLFVCIIRRHRGAMQNAARPDDRLAHMRKISDATVTSGNGTTLADSLSLRPLVPPSSSSNVQRSTSISSLPFFNSLIGRESRAAMGHIPIPQDPGLPPLEEVITPYTLPQMNDTPEKKHTDGEWPVFDQPSAPPQNTIRMTVIPSQTPPPKANRYNPPAYSESDTTTPLTPTMSRHHNQDSMDSTLSTPVASEASNSTVRRALHTPANSTSSSGHMPGIPNPVRASTSTFQTMQTSASTRRTSVGQVSMARGFARTLFTPRSRDTMDHAEERTEESFSPSEIA